MTLLVEDQVIPNKDFRDLVIEYFNMPAYLSLIIITARATEKVLFSCLGILCIMSIYNSGRINRKLNLI